MWLVQNESKVEFCFNRLSPSVNAGMECLSYHFKCLTIDDCTFELSNFYSMIRQIIFPTSNTYTLKLPDELVGKEVEVLAFEIRDENEATIRDDKHKSLNKYVKASDIFKDCRVDLTNYKFDRDAANTYD